VEKSSSPTPVTKVRGRIALTSTLDLPSSLVQPTPPIAQPLFDILREDMVYVLITHSHAYAELDNSVSHVSTSLSESRINQRILHVELPASLSPRTQLLLHTVLQKSTAFVHHHLSLGRNICIACPTGKDLCVGVALVALQLYFDNDGYMTFNSSQGEFTYPLSYHRYLSSHVIHVQDNKIDKSSIRTRLQWIITSRPQANPSRSTLKRVNEFLMSHKYNSNRKHNG
jgi:tRNA A64-2'-O-ribosylphosphate transferase